jgi:hypothetical protein
MEEHLNPESNALYVAAAAELMKTTRMLTWSNIRNTLFQEDMRINSFFEMLQHRSTTTKEAPCQLGGPYTIGSARLETRRSSRLSNSDSASAFLM